LPSVFDRFAISRLYKNFTSLLDSPASVIKTTDKLAALLASSLQVIWFELTSGEEHCLSPTNTLSIQNMFSV
jgi:hypothetical protein